MKLYKISQTKYTGYDTYSDAVVAAISPDDARKIHPSAERLVGEELECSQVWCESPEEVTCVYLGMAAAGVERGVICASFHAG